LAILDFKEIPEANKASGHQDAFELFAREVLHLLGFKVLQGPARGPDLGKDLIVEETRGGLIADTKLKWLVSCKHFAHTGASVRPDDEKNVFERVAAAGCDGFLGFYSTLPSSGLSEMLHRQQERPVKFFDHEEIERHLLASPEGRDLVRRYFPLSAKKLRPTPAKVFDDVVPLNCENCGKNLLDPPSGIWVLWHAKRSSGGGNRYVDFHFACKGECDRILEAQVRARHASLGFIYDGWDDIPDMNIPTVFIRKVMAIMNGLVRGDAYEPEVFDKVKTLLLSTFPLVSRHLSDEDRETIKHLQMIPDYLGGMGD
jgi:hypothetical protein